MKKKILFLIGSINRDGASTLQLTLLKYLDYEKFFAHLVVFTDVFRNKRLNKMLEDAKTPITILKAPKHKLNPYYYFKLYQIIKNTNPDLVVNFNPQLSTIVRLICKILKIKNVIVYTVKISSLKSIIRLQEGFSRRLSDKFIGVSNEVKEELVKIPERDKYTILNTVEPNQNPIDLKKYINKYKIEKANRIFLNIARHHPQKNQENLIIGFAAHLQKHPNDILIITGWGQLAEKLKTLVEKENLKKNIILTGPLDDIWNEYAIADYFVMSSLFEGLPMVCIEAISFGLPLLLTDIGEFRDFTDGNAIFFDGFSSKDIEAGFNKISHISPEQYAQMSQRSLEIYNEIFQAPNMARKYEEVFIAALS